MRTKLLYTCPDARSVSSPLGPRTPGWIHAARGAWNSRNAAAAQRNRKSSVSRVGTAVTRHSAMNTYFRDRTRRPRSRSLRGSSSAHPSRAPRNCSCRTARRALFQGGAGRDERPSVSLHVCGDCVRERERIRTVRREADAEAALRAREGDDLFRSGAVARERGADEVGVRLELRCGQDRGRGRRRAFGEHVELVCQVVATETRQWEQ